MSVKTLSCVELLCFGVSALSTVSTWGRPISLSPSALSGPSLSLPAAGGIFSLFLPSGSSILLPVLLSTSSGPFTAISHPPGWLQGCSTAWISQCICVFASVSQQEVRQYVHVCVCRELRNRERYEFVWMNAYLNLVWVYECSFAVVKWLILKNKKQCCTRTKKRENAADN